MCDTECSGTCAGVRYLRERCICTGETGGSTDAFGVECAIIKVIGCLRLAQVQRAEHGYKRYVQLRNQATTGNHKINPGLMTPRGHNKSARILSKPSMSKQKSFTKKKGPCVDPRSILLK